MILYQLEENLGVEEFRDVLIRSTLAERRPVADISRLTAMLLHANLKITARKDGQLIGVARSLTDFAFCTYLSDLAVDAGYQHQGIGKELIRLTKLAAPEAKVILLAAPKATGYYPRIGMTPHEFCFFLDDVSAIK